MHWNTCSPFRIYGRLIAFGRSGKGCSNVNNRQHSRAENITTVASKGRIKASNVACLAQRLRPVRLLSFVGHPSQNRETRRCKFWIEDFRLEKREGGAETFKTSWRSSLVPKNTDIKYILKTITHGQVIVINSDSSSLVGVEYQKLFSSDLLFQIWMSCSRSQIRRAKIMDSSFFIVFLASFVCFS